MKIDRSTTIGVIVTKGGNSTRAMARMERMGVKIMSEPAIRDTKSHNQFVKNIFSLREKTVSVVNKTT